MKVSLKRVRSQLGMTQDKLSELSGISVPTIIDAEKGRIIRLTTAYAILKPINEVRKESDQAELDIDDLTWKVKE